MGPRRDGTLPCTPLVPRSDPRSSYLKGEGMGPPTGMSALPPLGIPRWLEAFPDEGPEACSGPLWPFKGLAWTRKK